MHWTTLAAAAMQQCSNEGKTTHDNVPQFLPVFSLKFIFDFRSGTQLSTLQAQIPICSGRQNGPFSVPHMLRLKD
jgi:hypothetical protein